MFSYFHNTFIKALHKHAGTKKKLINSAKRISENRRVPQIATLFSSYTRYI